MTNNKFNNRQTPQNKRIMSKENGIEITNEVIKGNIQILLPVPKKVKLSRKALKKIAGNLEMLNTSLDYSTDYMGVEYDITKVHEIQSKLDEAVRLIFELRENIITVKAL